ncbi:MAG: sigma-54-dependent Fis family transcriptional regulator [Deltaproteobacteria bacterium]|nr:sigma-54-dependent Fis family transcriptional regulator [Deltaproteobacteria bacterium]
MDKLSDKILIVDDELHIQTLFQRILAKEGYSVDGASSAEEALKRLEAEWFDLLITDLRIPGLDGIELLKQAKQFNHTLPCIVLTAYGSIDSAVRAMKEGAFDYLTKPVNNEEIKLVVRNALELHRLTREVEILRNQIKDENKNFNIIGRSKPMRDLFRLVKLVANTQTTILIQGESGTGKELIARAIHNLSPRRERPFIAIDCGALPETLLESELFGHVRGSFTGAVANKKGLFEEADGGTILLDEIGDTTAGFQSKLLRVLQENEIRPVGSNKTTKVDVRVLSATNKDLKQEVEQKNFRHDLYYRLAVVPITVPPLRRRSEDIPLLSQHFVQKYCKQNGLECKQIKATTLRKLLDYPWPGNVRELENVIERAVLLSPGPEIGPEALSQEHQPEEKFQELLPEVAKGALEVIEKEKIQEALQRTRGKRSHAARLLGISRATLYNKLKRYQLSH